MSQTMKRDLAASRAAERQVSAFGASLCTVFTQLGAPLPLRSAAASLGDTLGIEDVTTIMEHWLAGRIQLGREEGAA